MTSEKRILTVVPARAGSTGVPGKNFVKIEGSSLTERAWSHASNYEDLGPIILSTDNYEFLDEIRGIESEKGIEGTFIEHDSSFLHYRESYLATAKSSVIDTLRVIMNGLESRLMESFLGVLLLQPTSPLRNMDDVRTMRNLLIRADENSSIVSFTKIVDAHPARMYTSVQGKYLRLPMYAKFEQARRQDLPKVLIRDGAFYFIGRNLVNAGMQIGNDLEGFERSAPWTVNVDSEDDMVLAKHFLRKLDF